MRKIWLLGAVVVAGFSLVAGFPGRYPAAEAIGPAVGDPVIAAAGDIACNESPGANQRAGDADDYSPDGCQMTRTAAVLKARRLAAILPLGDEQYPSGSAGAFESSYAKTWGTDRAPVHPVPGNHEYGTPHAAGYYGYFKAAAGDPAKGYYSWSLGSWHFIAINANCGEVGSCRAGSAEERWLKADLAAHPAACTVAYWHQPRFSSGPHHSDAHYQPFWNDLYAAGADIVLNGHDHDYERFAPQTPTGVADPAHGIREFVVGTGGKSHYRFGKVEPNSAVRNGRSFGVLEITLHRAGYDWKFVPATGTFTDSGSSRCHRRPARA